MAHISVEYMSLDQLVKQARFVDTVDAFTGPVSAFAYSTGSEYLLAMATSLTAIEIAIKIPFIVHYVAKTHDKKAVLYWGAKELFSNLNPELGYIDIFPAYSLRAKYVLGCEG